MVTIGGATRTPYEGVRAVLLTRHDKDRVVRPVLEPSVGLRLEVDDAFDTDLLGTFTGEIQRPGTQLEAGLEKARLACSRNESRIGLGSEGAFGPSASTPFLSENRELLVWWDQELSLRIVGRATSLDTSHRSERVSSAEDVLRFAASVGFPEQGVILRTGGHVFKNLVDEDVLLDAYRAGSPDDCVVETDLRAHRNPARRRVIAEAARDLASRLNTCCRDCGAPGFGPERVLAGRPCSACRFPTALPRANVLACVRCSYSEEVALVAEADPAECWICNP